MGWGGGANTGALFGTSPGWKLFTDSSFLLWAFLLFVFLRALFQK